MAMVMMAGVNWGGVLCCDKGGEVKGATSIGNADSRTMARGDYMRLFGLLRRSAPIRRSLSLRPP